MPASAKELLRDALEHVPDDATIEDVMERLGQKKKRRAKALALPLGIQIET